MRDRKHLIYYGISVLVLAVLQSSLRDGARLLGAKPDLLAIFVFLIASRMHKEEAMGLGVVAGLFFDIVYGRYIGFYALLYMGFAIAASLAGPASLRERKWWPAVVLPPLLFLYSIMESFVARAIILYATKSGVLYEYGYAAHMVARILPGTLYNIIVLAVMYLPVLWILKKLEPKPLIQYDE